MATTKRKTKAEKVAAAESAKANRIAEAKLKFMTKRNSLLKSYLAMLAQQVKNPRVTPYQFVSLVAFTGIIGEDYEKWVHYALVFDRWSSTPEFDASDPDVLENGEVHSQFSAHSTGHLSHGIATNSPDYTLEELERYIVEVDDHIQSEDEKIERKANALKKARDLLNPDELAALGIPST